MGARRPSTPQSGLCHPLRRSPGNPTCSEKRLETVSLIDLWKIRLQTAENRIKRHSPMAIWPCPQSYKLIDKHPERVGCLIQQSLEMESQRV